MKKHVELSVPYIRSLLSDLLKQIPVFAEMSQEHFESLLDRARLEKYEPKEIIIRQGELAEDFYFLIDGQLRVTNTSVVPSKLVNMLQAGSFFGERGLLFDAPRSTTIDAAVASYVARFDKDTWLWLTQVAPQVVQHFTEIEKEYEDIASIPLPSSKSVLENLPPEDEASLSEEEQKQADQTDVRQKARTDIAIRALSDKPTENDLLGFTDYAKALADFIKNENTHKPLTIAIDAAWGMGKTTLMKLLKKALDESSVTPPFPTVWFNAWKYDEEEALWAALVLEILRQVREQSTWGEQLRLGLSLGWRRFDWDLLRQRVFRYVLNYVILAALLGLIFFSLAALYLDSTLVGVWQRLQVYIGTVGGIGALITALYATGRQIFDSLTKPLDLKLEKYIRQPEYAERIGFLGQFEEDFKRVIDVVTQNGAWPLVVFIDDLDRCAPPKPVEIIEAINLLLDAEHCVFILAMDSQTVAGSIEAKYEDLAKHLNETGDPLTKSSLGQHFLEKIIQINFHIPKAGFEQMVEFIDQNMSALTSQPSSPPSQSKVLEAETLLQAKQREDGQLLAEAAQAIRREYPHRFTATEIETAVQEIRAKSFDDSEEVKQVIREAVPFLAYNPRKIKRFINLLRLQALIANRRGLLDDETIRLEVLGKWLIVTTLWPDLIGIIEQDQTFLSRLLQANQNQFDLKKARSTTSPDEAYLKQLEAQHNRLITDPLIKHLLEETDSASLFTSLNEVGSVGLSQYLYLTQMSSRRPGTQIVSESGAFE